MLAMWRLFSLTKPMPDLTKPITASELRNLRVQLRQTPRSMAKHLGVCPARYYRWERVGKVPLLASLAVQLIALLGLPEECPLLRRNARSSRERFQTGTRLGRLVVLRLIKPGGGQNLRVAVQCDCGVAKTWQAPMLNRYRQCSITCALSKALMPPDAPPTTPPPPDSQTPDAPEEWEAGL